MKRSRGVKQRKMIVPKGLEPNIRLMMPVCTVGS